MQEEEQSHKETSNQKDSKLSYAGSKEIHSQRKEDIIKDKIPFRTGPQETYWKPLWLNQIQFVIGDNSQGS